MRALIPYLPDAESFIIYEKHPHFEAYTSSNVKFNASTDALPKKIKAKNILKIARI